jgi:hypothetical protein
MWIIIIIIMQYDGADHLCFFFCFFFFGRLIKDGSKRIKQGNVFNSL